MSQTDDLRKAKQDKKDEYYTRLVDIETELSHYKSQFKDKIVFCNCDDPFESNFFKYFALNFRSLGLKKLITTCYAGSPIVTEQLSLFDIKGLILKKEEPRPAYKLEITEIPDYNADGAVDLTDVEFLVKNKKNTLHVFFVKTPLYSFSLFNNAEKILLNTPSALLTISPNESI